MNPGANRVIKIAKGLHRNDELRYFIDRAWFRNTSLARISERDQGSRFHLHASKAPWSKWPQHRTSIIKQHRDIYHAPIHRALWMSHILSVMVNKSMGYAIHRGKAKIRQVEAIVCFNRSGFVREAGEETEGLKLLIVGQFNNSQ
jgi:Fe-S cluster biosynthesis and repair protein YggX